MISLAPFLEADLNARALDLRPVGVNSVGWIREDALKVVDALEKNGVTVLGGDVWRLLDGRLRHSLETWYYNPKDDSVQEIARSAARARTFISNFILEGAGVPIFDIVGKSEPSQHGDA